MNVSAALRKLIAVCVCFVPLKIFLNFARGTIFRNIEISEYRAFATMGRPPFSDRESLSTTAQFRNIFELLLRHGNQDYIMSSITLSHQEIYIYTQYRT